MPGLACPPELERAKAGPGHPRLATAISSAGREPPPSLDGSASGPGNSGAGASRAKPEPTFRTRRHEDRSMRPRMKPRTDILPAAQRGILRTARDSVADIPPVSLVDG